MLHQLSPRKHPELAVGLLLLTFLLGCLIFTSRASSQSARLAQDLDSQFLQHQTIKLDAAAAAAQVQATGHLSLVTSDASFDLELTPHDMRGVGYRAEEVGPDGVTRTIDPGPVRTFKGQVQGGGQARLTIDGSVVEGMIITPSQRYYVEPASRYSKAAKSTDYVMYAESDVLASSTGECGVTMNEQVNQRAEGLGILARNEKLKGLSTAVEKSQPESNAALLQENAATSPRNDTERPGLAPTIMPSASGCNVVGIQNGQVLSRTLTSGCAFQGGQQTDSYSFSGAADQQVVITMSSAAF